MLCVEQWRAIEAVKLTSVCMQDVSTGVLVSENMGAVQEVLWRITRELAVGAAYKHRMTNLLT